MCIVSGKLVVGSKGGPSNLDLHICRVRGMVAFLSVLALQSNNTL